MNNRKLDTSSFIAPARRQDSEEREEAFDVEESVEIGYTSGVDKDDKSKICEVTDKECYAKRAIFGNQVRYFAKVGLDGLLHDPWDALAGNEGTKNRQARRQGREKQEFVEVNKKTFDFYLGFLRGRNRAWKHNAERERING
jgi:hypothetical protein